MPAQQSWLQNPRWESKADLKNQTRIFDEQGERVRINAQLKAPETGAEDYNNWLIQKPDNFSTCYELFQYAVKNYGDKNFLGDRRHGGKDFKFKTYSEISKVVDQLGSALLEQANVKENSLVGIYAGNCWEWTVNGIAANCYGYVLVPMYDTLGDQAMRYVTEQCKMDVILTDTEQRAKNFITSVQAHAEGRKIKTLICFNKCSAETVELAKANDLNLVFQEDLLEKQGDKVLDHKPPKPEDIFCICYTSGTTGNPKGVVQTHRSWLADLAGILLIIPEITSDDVWLSYLPSAHVFERMIQTALIQAGASCGYFGGDPKQLIADAGVLRPTIFGGVPRVWNKVYAKIQAAKKESAIKNFLISMAEKKKVTLVKKGICRNDTLWDKIVFKKIQALLGGRVRIAVTGAAPIKNEVMNCLRAALGCYVVEAYGQTECNAAATGTAWGDPNPSIGAPIGSIAIKLASVEEMNYHSKDDQGEICLKGPVLMKEYYNNPEKTAETIDKDGWLHTGDVGQWQEDGTLKIIDRAKHIFKTSLGEYIAPEKIENIYLLHEAVGQIFVYGDSLKTTLVAVVVPPIDVPGTFEKWAGAPKKSVEDLIADDAINQKLLKELQTQGRGSGLKGFENIKALTFVNELMSVDNDLLTPTMKTKRPNCKKHFMPLIEKMYEKLQALE